uniref:DUF1618 domain-containing protein n=1 Tax=Oryza punctata TaxID=4537 RepID=A0A0E0M4E9_ORYPU
MATVFPYRWSRTEHLSLRPPCHGGDPLDAHQPLPWILLDVRAYIADHQNATTAAADLGNGHRIQITIWTAPPPLVSYICAWSPTTDPARIFAKEIIVGCVNADLITIWTAPPPLVSYICAWSPTTDPARIFAKEIIVGCVNADLVFLRLYSDQVYDLVYRAGGRPSLTLIRDPDLDPTDVVNGFPREYLRSLDNIAVLRRAGGGFYACSLDLDFNRLYGHYELCFMSPPSMAMATPREMIVHFTNRVITLDDGQGVVAFIDLKRGINICNVLAHGNPGSYLPLPPELTNSRSSSSSLCRDIAIVNGLLTIVRLRTFLDPDTGCWSWDLSTWSKPVAHLDDNEDWQKGFMIVSSDITVDATSCNVELLPKLEGCPAMTRLELAHPTLSLTDANVVYVMGKVGASDEKAVVLTLDMANKRVQRVSVYDAERIINDFDYAYTQSTISQYFFPNFNAATGVVKAKGLKRSGEFRMGYPRKQHAGVIDMMDSDMVLCEPLQQDVGDNNTRPGGRSPAGGEAAAMATVFPYRWRRTEHLSLRPPCHGGDPLDAHQPLPWILLDVRAYIADHQNATTAAADLGNGHRIQITIWTAPPPLVSYICAWSPTTDPARIFAKEITSGASTPTSDQVYDLVYRAGGRPSLTLIRDPDPADFKNGFPRQYLRSLDDVALLRRAGGGFYACSLDLNYNRLFGHHELCLYESTIDGDGKWSFENLLLHQLLKAPREMVVHFPDRVITLDDGQGVVAFIDLKRGINICNLLAHGNPGSVKGNLKRPLKFHMQYPHKRLGETISRSDNPMDLHEPLRLDAGSYDETEGMDMDLEYEMITTPAVMTTTAWSRTEHLTLCPPSHGGDPLDADEPLPWILLDVRAYIADHQNATTATADLGNGHRIQITIWTAPPPLVSYICAWSPTADPARIFAKEIIVGCVNADLVFLRLYSDQVYDLVYRAGGRPSLTLIQDPDPADFATSFPREYLRFLGNIALLRSAGGGFYACSLEMDLDRLYGHHELCLYDSTIHGDGKWSLERIFLPQLLDAPRQMIVHYTDKVIILDDGQGVVAFIDLERGIHICNVLAHGCPGSYLPLPPELTNSSWSSSLCRDIAIVNGLLTIVRLRRWLDSDTGCWSWDLSTWSKPVAHLDDNEGWHNGFMVDSSDITVDAISCNVELLPKLEGRPAMTKLQVARPTLSLTDANVVYVMGKVDISHKKAVVLTVDMANERLQTVSVYDAERIIDDFAYAYTQSTISQYFTTTECTQEHAHKQSESLKEIVRNENRNEISAPNKVEREDHFRTWGEELATFVCRLYALTHGPFVLLFYWVQRLGETISRSDNPMDLHEPLQLDAGSGMGTKDETEDSDNPMDLE